MIIIYFKKSLSYQRDRLFFSRPEKLHFSKNKKIFIFIKGVKVYGTDRQRTTGVY